MLGKRKRNLEIVARESLRNEAFHQTSDNPTQRDVFRHYFESHFEPLPQSPPSLTLSEEKEQIEEDDSCEESDWSGFEDEREPAHAVEVVEHEVAQYLHHPDETGAGKDFMTSRRYAARSAESSKERKSAAASKEDDAEVINLKNDLALQRLLKESHLLDQPTLSPYPTTNRLKIIDLRMQSAGAKDSLFAQKKMPMSHRKGIKAKAGRKEEYRRREARENGVILEKAIKSKTSSSKKRDRGAGHPSIGKFQGGTLRLSRKDVSEVNGPRQVLRGKPKKGS